MSRRRIKEKIEVIEDAAAEAPPASPPAGGKDAKGKDAKGGKAPPPAKGASAAAAAEVPDAPRFGPTVSLCVSYVGVNGSEQTLPVNSGTVVSIDDDYYNQTFSAAHTMTVMVHEQLARSFAATGGKVPVKIQVWDGAGPPAAGADAGAKGKGKPSAGKDAKGGKGAQIGCLRLCFVVARLPGHRLAEFVQLTQGTNLRRLWGIVRFKPPPGTLSLAAS